MTQCAGRRVLGGIQPRFCLLHGWEFKDDEAFGLPVAFQGFVWTAAREVFPAVQLHRFGRQFDVFLVPFGVG